MQRPPRILIELDPKLDKKLRKKAQKDNRKLRAVIEIALTEYFNREETEQAEQPTPSPESA